MIRPRRPVLEQSRIGAGVSGVVAGALTLGLSELLAGVLPSSPSLILAVAERLIPWIPPAVEQRAIEILGGADKAALVLAVVATGLAIGAVLGLVARRRFWLTSTAFLSLSLLGALAGMADAPGAVAPTLVVALLPTVAGLLALRHMLTTSGPAADGGGSSVDSAQTERRRFLRFLAATGALGVLAGTFGRLLGPRRTARSRPAGLRLPATAAGTSAPNGSAFAVNGLPPLFTPNKDFYRIDTVLSVPEVDLGSWRLRVTGLVDRPLDLSYDELVALPQVEAPVTLCCVSNKVGDSLVGTARWQGVPLAQILQLAGVRAGATQLVGRSIDGWTGGFPTAAAFDGRTALVAVGMNGEPLPRAHGFPARLVVAGLYGYVSATKWLTEIELTTAAFDGYWVSRGWGKQAPVKTQSRIDVPRFGSELRAGTQTLAGHAWAPTRGISAVEVSVDRGPWAPATLADEVSRETWRQWRYDWDALPGRHEIRVRATDGLGAEQVAEPSPPLPDGATGYHTIRVRVVA